MGIHHTYKSNRGERSLAKQQKQAELHRRAQERRRQQQQQQQQDEAVYVVPTNEVVTLDTLTRPKNTK
jgi:hypothetical protein